MYTCTDCEIDLDAPVAESCGRKPGGFVATPWGFDHRGCMWFTQTMPASSSFTTRNAL